MSLKFWWLFPFVGLVSWITFFFSIARKNYEHSLWSSVLKPRNKMVQGALGVSFLTIVNGILWLAIGRGLIVNIFQQALMVVFEMSVFQYALKIFDPLQRWLSRDFVKKCCNVIKLSLGVTSLVLAVLVRIKEVYGVDRLEENYENIAVYFLVIDFIVSLLVCYFIWVFFNLYITVRRGINYNSAEQKEPEEFDLRKRWFIDDIDLEDFSHTKDPHCINVLKLQKIMLERVMFYMFLVLSMNIYKLSWGSSQFECSSRVSCTPSISERNFQRAVNNLSYWLPDLIAMVVWLFLLMKPIEHISLPDERMSDDITRSAEKDSSPSLSSSRDSDSIEGGIKLSIISNSASAPTDGASYSPQRTFSDNKNNNGVSHSSLSSEPMAQEFREIAISCQEMILFHRESGIPVATLFAGSTSTS
jgi:hypothetical protein